MRCYLWQPNTCTLPDQAPATCEVAAWFWAVAAVLGVVALVGVGKR